MGSQKKRVTGSSLPHVHLVLLVYSPKWSTRIKQILCPWNFSLSRPRDHRTSYRFPTENQAFTFANPWFLRRRGLRPILDLSCLIPIPWTYRFKMLTLKLIVSQILTKDWFVMIYLKDAYFHIEILPEHRKFLIFAFPPMALLPGALARVHFWMK